MAIITFISQFFPPETNAAAHRVETMVSVLAQEHELHVFVPEPGYPSPELYKQADLKTLDEENPAQVLRIPAFEPHNPSLIKRALKEISFSWKLIRKARMVKADIVIVSTPSMFLIPFAWALARSRRAKFIIDVRDITWRYIRETAETSRFNTVISLFLEKLMVFFLRKADLNVCATPGIDQILQSEYHLSPENVITVMNGISDEMVELGKKNGHAVSATEKPIVTYIGLFGKNQGVGVLLDAAKKLPGVQLMLVGDGPDRAEIHQRLETEKITNLQLVGYVTSLHDLVGYYYQSSILIGLVKNSPVVGTTALPSKIFEYMAFGKPIIYSGEGLASSFLNDVGCAVTIPTNDPDEIATAISTLLADPVKMKLMGEKGQDYVDKNFRRRRLMSQLLTEIQTRFAA